MTTSHLRLVDARTVVLRIPALTEDACIGAGCCVVSADHAIRAELESWPGVTEVALDVVSGMATVCSTTVPTDQTSPQPSKPSDTQLRSFPSPITVKKGGERYAKVHNPPRCTLLRRV